MGPEGADALPTPAEAAGAPESAEATPAAETEPTAEQPTARKATGRKAAAKKAAKKAASGKASAKKASAAKRVAAKKRSVSGKEAAAKAPTRRSTRAAVPAPEPDLPRRMAVVPVRDGHLPLGGDEAVAEADGRALLIGDGAEEAASHLAAARHEVLVCEQPTFTPGAWAAGLASTLGDVDVVILPASPDGRDLAPRLAAALGRPLLAGAVTVGADGATVARRGGLVTESHVVVGPFVATLQPGVRGVDRRHPAGAVTVRPLTLSGGGTVADAELVELLPADPSTMDLAEAPRLVGAGAGLGSADAIAVLAEVADALGASTGGTRVVTDWGWMPVDRQIGTTGVTVQPELYLAFGISGAVQHTAGLGQPAHVISVNLDASCPMMAMADLAVVADAPATLAALAERLGAARAVPTAADGEAHELQPSLPAGAVPTETVPTREAGTDVQ